MIYDIYVDVSSHKNTKWKMEVQFIDPEFGYEAMLEIFKLFPGHVLDMKIDNSINEYEDNVTYATIYIPKNYDFQIITNLLTEYFSPTHSISIN